MSRASGRRFLARIPALSKHWLKCGLALAAGIAVVAGCGGDDNGSGGDEDYTLSVVPAALTIDQGADGATVVNINRTEFTGAVTLSLGNLPAGVTGSFNPAAPTGDNSTLTLTVDAAVAPGVYNLTVDGSGTPGNRSKPLTLTVSPSPDYALSLAPAALTIVQGANGITDVTLTRTNFTGAVTLTLGGAPAGITGSFDPAAPTGTSSALTVSVETTVAPGVYNLTVDGDGAPGSRSTALALTVTAAPADYGLSLAPAAFSVAPGADGNTTVTITRTNFAGAVTLTLGGAPAGITGGFNPAAPTGTSSTLTVSVGGAVAPGVYNLTVDGAATAGNHSTPLTLTVTQTPDYAISLSNAALTISQGANLSTVVTLTRSNFAGAVTLTLGGAPAGVTGVFAPTAPTGVNSTLTVSVGAAVTPGVYNLTVDGTGTAGNRSTPLTLTVALVDYGVSINPTTLSIQQGANLSTLVTLTRTNFAGAVTLTLGGAPAGVTGVFAPTAPTGTNSTLTVSVAASVAPGVYNLTVDGAATAGNHSTPLTLTVTAIPTDYTISLGSASMSIAQGANLSTLVTLTRTNFTGAVTLTLGGAPAGVTGSFAPTAPTGANSTLTVTVGAAVTPGVYNLTVDGAATLGNRSTPLTLTVTASTSGNVTLDFSACPVEDRPLWVGGQDGNGAWAALTGVSDVYHFNVTSGRGGYAFVLASAGSFQTLVQLMTQAELTAVPITFCGPDPAGKTITGTAAGIAGTNQALISLGGRNAPVITQGSLNFTITGVPSGLQDLVGYRRALLNGNTGQSVVVRRDQNIADGGSVGRVNFDSTEAFAPASATVTVGGLLGGDDVALHGMDYRVGADCLGAPLYSFGDGGTSFTAFGIPAGQQRANDFHGISISAQNNVTNGFRTIVEYFHTLANRTVTLGAAMPTPTISTLSAPYKRLQAVFTLPADFNFQTQFTYSSNSRSVTMMATVGYLGGQATTLAFADYSGLAGWDNGWVPSTTDTGTWVTQATGGSLVSLCTESANRKIALLSGTF